MDLRVLRLQMSLISSQCTFALRGTETLRAGLRPPFGVDDVWVGAQQLLVGAGNVGKALWGIGGKGAEARAAQREPIRRALEVDDRSPLRTVAVRNHLEHMDERIFDWAESGSPAFVDGNVGPQFEGFDPKWVFRHLDPTSGLLTFWGDAFDVDAVTEELARIQPIAHRIFYG